MSEVRASYAAGKAPRISEHQEQVDFIQAVYMLYGRRSDFVATLLFSPPNGMWAGGDNRWALINKFKAEGMNPGVADVIYLQPRGPYNCLAIEMKAAGRKKEKAGGVSEEQQEFLNAVNANGGLGVVCYGCTEAIDVFSRYINLEQRK